MLPPRSLDLAERQHGVLARYQLRSHLRRGQVEHALGSPSLERLERGVYRLRGTPRTPLQLAIAASLRARPRATATGPRVLADYGFDGFAADAAVRVLTAPGRRVTGVTFAHDPDPDPDRAVRACGDARLAAPLDAYLESAPELDRTGERAFRLGRDRLRFEHGIDDERLVSRARRLVAGTPAIGRLLTVLELAGLGAESEGERTVGPLLWRFDPPPEPQVWLPGGFRADWYFRGPRVAVEYLGRTDHDGPANRTADRDRAAALLEHDVLTFPIRAEDLRESAALLARLAGTLAVRSAQLGVRAPRLR